jgi:hypothetical protein
MMVAYRHLAAPRPDACIGSRWLRGPRALLFPSIGRG